MPWGSSLFPLLIVTSSGRFTGLFVYSPAPGAGNLIASITASSGTDPFGNSFSAGITSYTHGGGLLINELAGTLSFNDTLAADPLTSLGLMRLIHTTASGQSPVLALDAPAADTNTTHSSLWLLGAPPGALTGPVQAAFFADNHLGGFAGQSPFELIICPGAGGRLTFGSISSVTGTPAPNTFMWLAPSGDATGVTDATAINQAFSVQNYQVVALLPSTPANPWFIKCNQVTATTGQWIQARGAYIKAVGTGDVFRFVDTTATSGRNPIGGAGILGFPTIDGAGAGSGSNGVHAGDIFQLRTEVFCQNFAGTPATNSPFALGSGYGVLFDNANFFTEQMYARIFTSNCANGIGYTKSGAGTASFARADVVHYVQQSAIANNGVVVAPSMTLYDLVQFGLLGNFTGSSAGPAGAALVMGANSLIAGPNINFGPECGAGVALPQSINFGANTAIQGSGYANFHNQFAASNNSGSWQVDGEVLGEATLPRLTFAGEFPQTIATGGTLFAQVASVLTTSPAGAVTGVILQAGSRGGQQVTVINRAVAANTITFAVAGTSNVAGGAGVSIPGQQALTFWWDTTAALWFPAP